MEFNTNFIFNDSNFNKMLTNKVKKLNNLFIKETNKGNKVSYYYEDKNNIISYNKDICFYAASSIKILVCLILFEKAEKNEVNLNDKILITNDDLKQGTGVIKNQNQDSYYSILELIKLTLVESDNTSYLKLVSIVGKENIKSYGLSLGAIHTMEGKDSFGIISCSDMIIYWKKIIEYINSSNKYSSLFKEYLSNPIYKIIKNNSISNNTFLRKYGSFDIAYHEAGYIDSNNPYFLIILTQLNQKKYKNKFINKTARKIQNINKHINNSRD